MLKLIIEDDEGRKTVVPFVRDEITIGRQEGCTIRLTERNVSRRHARLLRSNGSVVVEDLGSYNGIRINGQRIAGTATIADGDLIQIGDYDLAIQHERAAAPPPIPPVQPLDAAPANSDSRTTLDLGETPQESAPAPAASQTLDESLESDMVSAEEPAPAPVLEPEIARRHSTSVIRVKEAEGAEGEVLEIDPSQAPRLFVLTTEFAGREFACIRTQLTIGRAVENDISLDHRSLSRTHVKLVRGEGDEWRVIDQASANGLLVNGEIYAQATLRAGDVIELGHVKLKFLAPGEEFNFVPGEFDGPSRRRGKGPLLAALLLLVAGGAAAIYFGLGRTSTSAPALETEQTKLAAPAPPAPTAVPTPAPTAPDPAETIASAKDAFEHLQWVRARRLLSSLPDGTVSSEAQELLSQIDAEEAHQKRLENAQAALAEGDLAEARKLLEQSSGTKLQAQRRGELQAAVAQAAKLTKAPAAGKKLPVATAGTEDEAKAQALYEEGVTLLKAKQVREARTALERCIKLQPTLASCHMMLGTVFAKLSDPEKGAHHYREFLRLAPNDKAADKVRAILETYESMKK